MSDPKPTPRDRKARRKWSPGQIAYLKSKSEKEKQRAKREEKMRLDGWYLNTFFPEIAKAKRKEGWENGIKKWAERRDRFIQIVAEWPAVMTPEKMRIECKGYLARERGKPWRDAPRHHLDKPESVQKKIYELGLYRYNPRERRYFKCGSVEEAEATHRLAEQEAERRRLAREEAERVERERVSALWEADQKKRQEAVRLKTEADQAERDRSNSPAIAGWHDFIPEELKGGALVIIRRTPVALGIYHNAQSLDDAKTGQTERMLSDRDGWVRHLQALHDHERKMRQVAEAVLVAD
jgi:hypothetical protein